MPLAPVLTIFFFAGAGVAAVVSAMLYYHWIRYGMSVAGTLLVMVFYGVGTAVILMSMLGLISQI